MPARGFPPTRAARQGRLVLDAPPGVSPGQPGDNNRPPLAAEATCQLDASPATATPATTAANRCRAAVTSSPTAASASPINDPAGPGGATSIPVATPARVKNTRTTSARPANRRSHPRTVEPGTPTSAATRRQPAPDAALAINADMITCAEYILLSRQNTGNNTCVDRHPEHRDRRGRTHCPPAAVRTSRRRAYPHATNGAEHPGHPSRPATRSNSTTEPVPATVNNGRLQAPSHGPAADRSSRTRTAAGPLPKQLICTLVMQINQRNPRPAPAPTSARSTKIHGPYNRVVSDG